MTPSGCGRNGADDDDDRSLYTPPPLPPPLFLVVLHFPLRRPPDTFPTFWPLIPSRVWFVASIGVAQWPCLTGRFPFERAPLWTDLVPLKGLRPPLCSLNQQRAPSLLLCERTWLGKQYTKYAFSLLHDRPLSWPLFPFKYPLFSSLLPSPSPPPLLPYANARRYCKKASKRIQVQGAVVFLWRVVLRLKESGGFLLEGITITPMQPNPDTGNSSKKNGEKFVCGTKGVNICPKAGAGGTPFVWRHVHVLFVDGT